MDNYSTYNDFAKTRRGLRCLLATYGGLGLTLEQAIGADQLCWDYPLNMLA